MKYPVRDRQQDLTAEPDIQLFNLVEDLGEQRNVAMENMKLVEQLRQRMLELDAAIEAGARPTWKKPAA